MTGMPKYGQIETQVNTFMNLARHSISSTSPINIFDARFDADCNIFTATTQAGFAIYRAYPLQLIRKRGKSCSDLESPSCLTYLINRADRWNALCSCAIALFKSPFPVGWWSQSALSSQQSYCLERGSRKGSCRTRVPGEGQRACLSERMACCRIAKASRCLPDRWQQLHQVWRMGHL